MKNKTKEEIKTHDLNPKRKSLVTYESVPRKDFTDEWRD